jgi:MFS family permease
MTQGHNTIVTEVDITQIHRWRMLVVAMVAATSTTTAENTVGFLIPELHRQGASLQHLGLLVAAAPAGLLLTTVLWGVAIDKIGERRVLLASLCGGIITLGATITSLAIHASLFVVGIGIFTSTATVASCNGASGRIVAGWFTPHRRGLAMGIRQMSQPLAMVTLSLLVPKMAQQISPAAGMLVPLSICVTALILVFFVISDPPRQPSRTTRIDTPGPVIHQNPYRSNRLLHRLHATSALLEIPQTTVWVYGLPWLVLGMQWTPASAGAVIAAGQALGAVGRILSGIWSDRLGSRTYLLRRIAMATAATMALLACLTALNTLWSVPVFIVASITAVADNGLAFTAVAENAGPHWSGRALGAQNTSQYVTSAAAAPIVGAIIGSYGFAPAFAVVALAPLLAAPLVPDDRSHSRGRRRIRRKSGGYTGFR